MTAQISTPQRTTRLFFASVSILPCHLQKWTLSGPAKAAVSETMINRHAAA